MPPKITVIAPLPCFSFEDLQGARGSPALPKSQSCGGEQSTTVNYNHDGSAKKFPNIFSKKVDRLWSFEKRDLTGCTFYHPVLLTQPRKIWRSPKKIFTESDLVPNANVAKIVNPVWLKKAYKMKVPTVSSIIACEGDKSVLSVASCKISSLRTFGTLLLFLISL